MTYTDNNAICPDLVVTGRYGHQNPFFVVPTFAAYIRPAVAEMVVSTALGHRILQGVNRSGSDRGVLATKLQHHRGAAIRLMAEDLTRDAMQTSNEILVCVLVFLLAEVSMFDQHGARSIIVLQPITKVADIASHPDSAVHFVKLATACRCGRGHRQCARRTWCTGP